MPTDVQISTQLESTEQPVPAPAVEEPSISCHSEQDDQADLSGAAEPQQDPGGKSPARGRGRKTEAEKLLELWAGDK